MPDQKRPSFGGLSLTRRILLVNIVPLVLLAFSFFYLDGFRERLIGERRTLAETETGLLAEVFDRTPKDQWQAVAVDLGDSTPVRIWVTDPAGRVVADSWQGAQPSFRLTDPESEGWQRRVARAMDEGIDWVVDATVPPDYVPPTNTITMRGPGSAISLAPDRTHMIEAQQMLAGGNHVVTLRNARDVRRLVRAERTRLGYIIGLSIILSVMLALFLARTIVTPLRKLALAANLVRFGQAREVAVPRLPSRQDEIGLLARSVSDMSHALREQMDATEAFAADTAHELKNPLASLSSAVETLRKITQPELREQLHDIIAQDVQRLDRLISQISELSRIDAQIARTRFQPVDLGAMLADIVTTREARRSPDDPRLVAARTSARSCLVQGDPHQLSRVIDNLIDNAISFSPQGGIVRVAATRADGQVVVTVDDEGPGVAESATETIFDRFHSDRPEGSFGKHSGLGLSIARTIIEAHGGKIEAIARDEANKGGRFVFRLPAEAAHA